jgi:hypothetical protein
VRLEDTAELQATYLRLTGETLPEQAQAGEGWPVHLDHCFRRIVLDAVFEDEWYDHVDGRPAYEALTADQLREAIAVAESMLDDPERVRTLNERSLRYRGELD